MSWPTSQAARIRSGNGDQGLGQKKAMEIHLAVVTQVGWISSTGADAAIPQIHQYRPTVSRLSKRIKCAFVAATTTRLEPGHGGKVIADLR